MSLAVALLVVLLVVFVVYGFPTRQRMVRAYTPVQGPHPIQRPFLALLRWQRTRRERQRRRHLRLYRS
jgi:hypothetical protein